jgi:hypothetical protein
MTTDKEKLQKLFQAALLDPSGEKVTLQRAFPQSAPAATAPVAPVPVVQTAPEPVAQATAFVQPMANAGLDAVAAEELRILLDEQNLRMKRKRRRETIGALAVFLAVTGGGFGWFVQSPERVQAFKSAITEIRSVGDIGAIVAKYQKALDKIATRAQDIDAATESMGVSSNQEGLKDVYMDAEMKEMMGGKGKTVGERNRMLQEKFDDVKTKGLKGTVAKTAPEAADSSSTLQP